MRANFVISCLASYLIGILLGIAAGFITPFNNAIFWGARISLTLVIALVIVGKLRKSLNQRKITGLIGLVFIASSGYIIPLVVMYVRTVLIK